MPRKVYQVGLIWFFYFHGLKSLTHYSISTIYSFYYIVRIIFIPITIYF